MLNMDFISMEAHKGNTYKAGKDSVDRNPKRCENR